MDSAAWQLLPGIPIQAPGKLQQMRLDGHWLFPLSIQFRLSMLQVMTFDLGSAG
jgi:hypothetical protein